MWGECRGGDFRIVQVLKHNAEIAAGEVIEEVVHREVIPVEMVHILRKYFIPLPPSPSFRNTLLLCGHENSVSFSKPPNLGWYT